MKNTILVSFIFLLISCTATGPKFAGLEPAQDNKAIVYILRPPAITLSARKVNIGINGEEYIKLRNAGYTIARLDPGVYEFKQSFSNIVGDASFLKDIRVFEMELKESEIYFIGFDADSIVGVFPLPGGTMIVPMAFEFGFGVIEDELALEELKKCHYQQPGK